MKIHGFLVLQNPSFSAKTTIRNRLLNIFASQNGERKHTASIKCLIKPQKYSKLDCIKIHWCQVNYPILQDSETVAMCPGINPPYIDNIIKSNLRRVDLPEPEGPRMAVT